MSTLTCEASANAPPVCLRPPWTENPYGLVSLWDMLKVSAYGFIAIGSGIDNLQVKLAMLGEEIEAEMPELEKYSGLLEFIEGACNTMALTHTSATVRLIRKEQDSKTLSNGMIRQALREINRSFVLELETETFLHLRSENAGYLCKLHAFGPTVSKQFGSCGQDIWCAGNCFALELYDACVFHLMRTLERGLAAMAKRFGVSFEHRNWHNIIEEIEAHIRKLDKAFGPDWKDEQKRYSEAACQFMFIKDA